MNVAHLLNATATVSRIGMTNVGGRLQQAPVAAGTVKVRKPFGAGQRDLDLGDAMKVKVTHISYVLPDADVKRDDLWAVGAKKYRVTATLDTSKEHHMKVMLETIQVG